MNATAKDFLRKLNRPLTRRETERGVALVLVMIFLSLMLLLGLATTMTTITEVGVGKNLRLSTEAFDVADAGAAHAYELIRNMKGDFTCLLRGSNWTSFGTGYGSYTRDGTQFADRPALTFNANGS